jgi:hypothetical protein
MKGLKVMLVLCAFGFTVHAVVAQSNVTQRITTNEKYPINVIQIDGDYIAPIGWSKNGYFAYASHEHISDLRGYYEFVAVTIIDTVTDEEVTNYTTVLNATGGYGDQNYEYDETVPHFENFWLSEENEINNLLERNNIISVPNSLMDENLSPYGLEAKIQDEMQDGEFTYDEIFIVKNINNGRQKQIAESYVYEHFVILGFFKSPFEERIIFYTRIRHGGPSMGEVSYRWVGCHLSVGFE